jgi:hypothetical protein
MKNKMAIFEDYKIRRVYDENTGTWYFSVVDIIRELTKSTGIRYLTMVLGS